MSHDAVYAVADIGLQDTMDLAHLIGQRPSDTLRMNDCDIKDGHLHVKQASQDRHEAKNRDWCALEALIERIKARKAGHKVSSTRLVVTEAGKAMTASMLRGRFDKARETAKIPKADFQFRDLRAKVGTDKAESSRDILKERDQLRNTTVVMTEQYIRARKGKKITPTQ